MMKGTATRVIVRSIHVPKHSQARARGVFALGAVADATLAICCGRCGKGAAAATTVSVVADDARRRLPRAHGNLIALMGRAGTDWGYVWTYPGVCLSSCTRCRSGSMYSLAQSERRLRVVTQQHDSSAVLCNGGGGVTRLVDARRRPGMQRRCCRRFPPVPNYRRLGAPASQSFTCTLHRAGVSWDCGVVVWSGAPKLCQQTRALEPPPPSLLLAANGLTSCNLVGYSPG